MDVQFFQHHLLKRLFIPHCFVALAEIQSTINVRVYFWVLSSVSLIWAATLRPGSPPLFSFHHQVPLYFQRTPGVGKDPREILPSTYSAMSTAAPPWGPCSDTSVADI